MNRQTKQIHYKALNMPLGSSVLALLEMNFEPDKTGGEDSLHFHHYLEIGYCYYGHGSMTLGDEKISYGSNIFTVIPPNIPHMTKIGDQIGCSWEYLMIDINEFLSNIYKDTPLLAEQLICDINLRTHLVKAEDHQETAALIRKTIGVMREQKELYLEEAKGLLLALLVRVARWNRNAEEIQYPYYADNSTIITPALDYINRELNHPFKIEELAKICHISETHFRRIFAEYMKTSPIKYINQLRIRKACYELTRTNDSINAIAIRAGFPTLSTFNRNFRQITGISPQQFRKHPELYDPDRVEHIYNTSPHPPP